MSDQIKSRTGHLKAKAAAVSSPVEKVRVRREARKAEHAALKQAPDAPVIVRKNGKLRDLGGAAVKPQGTSGPTKLLPVKANGHAEPVSVQEKHDANRALAVIEADRQADELPPAKVTESEPMSAPQTLAVPLKFLHAALSIVPKEDVRYYLTGVKIHQLEDGQTRVVATDGKRLLVANLPNDQKIAWAVEGVIIPREELTRVLRYLGKDGELKVTFGEKHPTVTLAGDDMATFKVRPIDGKFPDYQRIIDESASVFTSERVSMETSQIDADFLKSAGAIAGQLGAKSVLPHIGGDSKAAIVFTFGEVPEALLYVMPMTAPAVCLSAPTVRMFGHDAIRATINKLKAAEKISRENAKRTKIAKFRDQSVAKADKIAERVASLQAIIMPAIAAPVAPAQEVTTQAA